MGITNIFTHLLNKLLRSSWYYNSLYLRLLLFTFFFWFYRLFLYFLFFFLLIIFGLIILLEFSIILEAVVRYVQVTKIAEILIQS